MAEKRSESTPTHHGHETPDVNIRVVALFALSMAVVLAGSLALMAWVFDVLHATPAGHGPRGSGPLNWAMSSRQGNGVSKLPTQSQGALLAATATRPPAPRLQTSPTADLQEMRRAENAQLQSYGWVDRSIGVVRIPIDRAMELVVEQGLPSWHEIPTPATELPGAMPEERR